MSLARQFRKPCFALDLFMDVRQREIVSQVVLPQSIIADRSISRNCAFFRACQDMKRGLDVCGILEEVGRWGGRNVMELIHAVTQLRPSVRKSGEPELPSGFRLQFAHPQYVVNFWRINKFYLSPSEAWKSPLKSGLKCLEKKSKKVLTSVSRLT